MNETTTLYAVTSGYRYYYNQYDVLQVTVKTFVIGHNDFSKLIEQWLTNDHRY